MEVILEHIRRLSKMAASGPYEYVVNEGNSVVLVIREWLPSVATVRHLKQEGKYVTQEHLWAACETEMAWEAYTVGTPGGPVPAPHLRYAMSDDEVKEHRYANQKSSMHPWNLTVKLIRDRIYAESTLYCNACLPLKYRSLTDSVGLHADKECAPPHNLVVSISIGQPRTFIMKRNSDGMEFPVELRHGDLLIMWGDTQLYFKHILKKEPKRTMDPIYKGVRYVLTFRQLGGLNLKDPSKGSTLGLPLPS